MVPSAPIAGTSSRTPRKESRDRVTAAQRARLVVALGSQPGPRRRSRSASGRWPADRHAHAGTHRQRPDPGSDARAPRCRPRRRRRRRPAAASRADAEPYAEPAHADARAVEPGHAVVPTPTRRRAGGTRQPPDDAARPDTATAGAHPARDADAAPTPRPPASTPTPAATPPPRRRRPRPRRRRRDPDADADPDSDADADAATRRPSRRQRPTANARPRRRSARAEADEGARRRVPAPCDGRPGTTRVATRRIGRATAARRATTAAADGGGGPVVLPLTCRRLARAPATDAARWRRGCARPPRALGSRSRPSARTVAADHEGDPRWHTWTPRQTKFVLDEDRIPRAWYNIAADLPVAAAAAASTRAPRQPIGPDDLAPLFPMALIGQEVSAEREIEIPEPVRDAYRALPAEPALPGPSARAALDTPAHIYYKYEGVSPAGSHKPNTALAAGLLQQGGGRQAPRDRDRRRPVGERAGLRRRAASGSRSRSTWSAPATTRSRTAGSSWRPTAPRSSPARRSTTNYGRAVLAETPDSPGSLGHRDQRGGRGRGHPRRHEVLARVGAQPRPPPPDGHRPGGDRADGDGRRGARRRHRLRRRRLELRRADVPVPRPQLPRRREATGSSPSSRRRRRRLTRGVYAYDFGDTAQDGAARQDAHARPRLHPRADPRRRPALPRHVAARVACSRSTATSRPGASTSGRRFEAGVQFARAEGILPAPEPTHAIRVAIDEALAAKEAGEARVILFNLCGHGHFDLSRLRALPERARSRTTSTRASGSRPRWPVCRRSDRAARRMPKLACWSCGRQIYTVAPLESLFAEERAARAAARTSRDERREFERRAQLRRAEPAGRPGPAARRPASAGSPSGDRSAAGPASRARG